MKHLPKLLFFVLIVRPVVLVLLGLNVLGRENLPADGPAVIIANHNSHLDTLVLMCLFPLRQLHKVRPVAAADYFLKTGFRSWFSLRCCGILPLDRTGATEREELFTGCVDALDDGEILILFPEGSRGDPESLSGVKKGVFFLLKERPETPLIPAVTHGLGRALPRGEALLVPFNCDVVIGEAMASFDSAEQFVSAVTDEFERLLAFCNTRRIAD